MKHCITKLWLLGLLLVSPLLWAEVEIVHAQQEALQELQSNIESGSPFETLERADSFDANWLGSYTVDEGGNVESLNLAFIRHDSLHFLRAFPHLRFLNIRSAENLTSMHGIETNTRLEKIWLMEVPVTRIEGLEKMERLTLLSIHEGQLTSMEGVKNLTALENLVLSRNKLERFEGLEELEALEFISVKDNPIDSMKGLGSKPKLEDLYIYRTNIRRLEDYDSLSDANIVVDRSFPFDENQDAIQSLEARGVDVYTP